MKNFNKETLTYHNYLESIVSAIPDLIFLVNEDGIYIEVFANGKEALLYKPKEEIIGRHVTDFFNESLSQEFTTVIHKALASKTLQCIEYELDISNKQEFYEARIMPTRIKENGKQTVMVIVRDMTEIQRVKTKMQYLATHDALTTLPNRTLIFEHLNHVITSAKRSATRGALLFIDIDGFKYINDTYSHKTGDTLLKDFALRLIHIIRESDIVGRLSGDEFLLILENAKDENDILNTVEKIKTNLLKPFVIQGKQIEVTVSIGIACYPANGENADQLIHAADLAMYEVKKNGKNNYTFYKKEFSL